jgi:phage terminase large subunit-like protein
MDVRNLPPELKKALEAELERRKKEERLRFWNQERRHLKQAAAIQSRKRFQGVFGGNRSGKTVYGAVRTALFCMGANAEPFVQDWCEEDQKMWYDFYGQFKDPVEMWAGTVNWDIHRDITQPELLKWIPQEVLGKSDIVYRRKGVIDYILFPWKTKLGFKSYDSGREAFQGKSLLYLWLDEEPEPDIWYESKMRLMDQKGYATLTMTPLKGLTWTYREIYLNESNDPNVESYQFTWDDNPWLDDSEKARMLASMSEDEISARKFGEFLAAGSSVFNRVQLLKRRRELVNREPLERMGWNEAGLFVPAQDGTLEIYKQPEPGRFYIVGADVAEGLPSGDNSVASVIDASTAEQVAEFAGRHDTTTFAKQLDWIGKKYNLAMVAPERNNNGHAVLEHLDKVLLYPVIYLHQDDERLGWPETAVTRPIVISFAQQMIRDAAERINSQGLVDEALTFVRNNRGRPEAAGKGKPGGQKDDRVFAWGIALVVRDMFGPPLAPVKPTSSLAPKPTPQNPWAHKDKDEDAISDVFAKFDPNQFAAFDMTPRRPKS